MFHFYIIYRYKCGFSLVKKKKIINVHFLNNLYGLNLKKKKKNLSVYVQHL